MYRGRRPSTLHVMSTEHASSDRLEYEIVDVFTGAPYAGNPLAIVYGGESLSTGQLQTLASEVNLSETSFPMPLTDDDRAAGATYRVRIFTPATELPFAGHPTIGTAWALARRGVIHPGENAQACGAGLIALDVPGDAEGRV